MATESEHDRSPHGLSNQLQESDSLYLRQHAQQPVAWQAWSEETLAKASKRNLPIFLSIGYSACHWCQQMSVESFSDEAVASYLNQHFVCIKVDREERPDIDDVYQTAHQLLNGRGGGWPLTAFLCPKTQMPYMAGTYFSKEGKEEQLGFRALIERVTDFYGGPEFMSLRDKVSESYKQLQQQTFSLGGELQSPQHLSWSALQNLQLQADELAGGFGSHPKFPMPVNLTFMLQHQMQQTLPKPPLRHLSLTLRCFMTGGLQDHIDGGFFRYSTDAQWRLPYFEKMLYDNGLLLGVCADAWLHMKLPVAGQAAAKVLGWLGRMQGPEGGFANSISADNAGVEGGYYLVPADHVAVLTDAEQAWMQQTFELGDEHRLPGGWHLSRLKGELNQWSSVDREMWAGIKPKLAELRHRQPAPDVDTKVVVSNNALVFKGLAQYVQALRSVRHRDGADVKRLEKLCETMLFRGLDFIRGKLWVNQRLAGIWQEGKAQGKGYLDDYAYLMDALLLALQVHWRDQDYQWLVQLAEQMLELFEDTDNGGLFYTPHDSEPLIYRPKPFEDRVQPSPNGVAAAALLQLGQLAAEPRYQNSAERILAAGIGLLHTVPDMHLTLLRAYQAWRQPSWHLLALSAPGDSWGTAVLNFRQDFKQGLTIFYLPETSEALPPEMLDLDPGEAILSSREQCLGRFTDPLVAREVLLGKLSDETQATQLASG